MATQTIITAPDYTESTLYNRGYQDVSFSLFKHPMSRDFGKKRDAASVKQSIEAILKTNYGERPLQPRFGTDIRHLLFEPMNPITEERLRDAVSSALMRSEPRANILEIEVQGQEENNRYVVRITFEIVTIPDTQTIDVILTTPGG